MSVNWDYYDKFDHITDKYLPNCGEGETKATQIVTAVTKLVYKWYNDGDVFDNTHNLEGWANDLSSYANWLDKYTKASRILHGISGCYDDDDYEDLLKDLADLLYDEEYLERMNQEIKQESIYDCNGTFRFVEYDDEKEDYWEEEEDEYE